MKIIKSTMITTALCLIIAACGSEKTNPTNEGGLAANASNGKVEASSSAATSPTVVAATFNRMLIADPLQRAWIILDPAFRADANCVQLATENESSKVLFSHLACPVDGRVSAVDTRFDLLASEFVAVPVSEKVEKGQQQAPIAKRFILKLRQRVEAPIEQGKQGQKQQEPAKSKQVELAVGEYEVRSIHEKAMERTEITLTKLCTEEYLDLCTVAFDAGAFKSIALTEQGLAKAIQVEEVPVIH